MGIFIQTTPEIKSQQFPGMHVAVMRVVHPAITK